MRRIVDCDGVKSLHSGGMGEGCSPAFRSEGELKDHRGERAHCALGIWPAALMAMGLNGEMRCVPREVFPGKENLGRRRDARFPLNRGRAFRRVALPVGANQWQMSAHAHSGPAGAALHASANQ